MKCVNFSILCNSHKLSVTCVKCIKLQSSSTYCNSDVFDVLQSQVIEFSWDDILQFQVDSDQMTFNFEYRREGRKPRWVHIFTPYVSHRHRNIAVSS